MGGGETTTFDSYATWAQFYVFGTESVLSSYCRPDKSDTTSYLTDTEQKMLIDNVQQNLIDTALKYPSVTFYIFIPPYSICSWDIKNQNGMLVHDIDALEIEISMLVSVDNIKLFAFDNRADIVCDLDNYKDYQHYSPEINSEILRCMKYEENMLTEDNYEEYIRTMRDFLYNYDYDSIYVE